MNGKQYNNVIDYTLKHEQCEDSLSTARAIFNNMGVALPQGDINQVCEVLKTNDYMGWRSCTMEEAQAAADCGIAAIGISENGIIVLSANDDEEPVAETASIMTLSAGTSVNAAAVGEPTVMDTNDTQFMAYYSYTMDTTTVNPPTTEEPPATEDPPATEEPPATEDTNVYLVDQLTGIQTFSNAADGHKYLSPNFKVGEFKCQDGSDEILIDMALVQYLQDIRDWAGAPITINSGYRTAKHNAAEGGAPKSLHIEGRAADIECSGKSPLQLAQRAETLGILGIEWNDDTDYTHIDTRTTRWHVKYDEGVYIPVSSFYNLK